MSSVPAISHTSSETLPQYIIKMVYRVDIFSALILLLEKTIAKEANWIYEGGREGGREGREGGREEEPLCCSLELAVEGRV